MRLRSLGHFLLATTALSSVSTANAQSLPTGYSTASGSVGFAKASGTLTINQTSPTAIVNYNSFSIGPKNTVNIVQPSASSALLNRVTGSTPSTIAGHLNANGQVYLINPNGIAITKTGVVKVGGGFVGSTLGMSDDEWKHGRKKFTGGGASAAVSNAGTITIGRGGYAALIGGTVTNSGMISVPMGKVGLGSGEAATLDVSGDGFLQIAVPTAAGGNGALIQETGTIRAAGGTVVIDAATARAAARNAVNISGGIDAHSISGHSGGIVIGGGEGGAVEVSGGLNVSGGSLASGGSVTITGRVARVSGTVNASGRTGGAVVVNATDKVRLTKAAVIEASGAQGGGVVALGTTLARAEGGAAITGQATATTTQIDAGAVVSADAALSGNGGLITVLSTGATSMGGTLSARGGAKGGDGGFVEISGYGSYALTGAVDAGASSGKQGTILIDPEDLEIANSGDSGAPANINPGFGNPNISYTAGGDGSGNDYYVTPAQLAAINGNITLQASRRLTVENSFTVSNGSVTLQAGENLIVQTGATITASGSITLAAAVNFNTAQNPQPGYSAAGALTINGNLVTTGANASITLQSGAGGIYLNGNSTTTGTGTLSLITTGAIDLGAAINLPTTGGLTLDAGTTITAPNSVSVGAFVLAGGAWSQNTATLPSFSATNFTLSGGSFLRATGGDGSTGAPYTLTDIYGLQGAATLLSSSFTLANAIDASSTSGWNNGAGFAPIGSFNAPYTGTFDGGGYTIASLTIDRPQIDYVGLFGASSGTLRNVGLVGGSISGEFYVGGLVGVQDSGSITNAYVTSAVSGAGVVGGLVGNQGIFTAGSISNAYTTGAVSASGDIVGGLVGEQHFAITNAYATGVVTGNGYYAGGLVGFDGGGSITNAHASGDVSGEDYVGGLVGSQSAPGTLISNSYATGTVMGGSLVGGLIGEAGAGSIANAYATGAVTGVSQTGGLVGTSDGPVPITNVYATGAVTGGASSHGGLIGSYTGGAITNAYWDTTTTGQQTGLGSGSTTGVTGVTTAQLANATTLAALNSGGVVWGNAGNQITPFLLSNAGPVYLATDTSATPVVYNTVATVAQLQAINNNLSGNYVLGQNIDATGYSGFTPIGENTAFSGTFNGLGNTISNLTISSTGDYAGLFGQNSGTIKNIGLIGGSVTDNADDAEVGELAGQNVGAISQAYATGAVSTNGSPFAAAGGLVGEAYGGTITQSYATGAVSGGAAFIYIGGLVGLNNGGAITQSYATGAVSGGANAQLGGLVGSNYNGTITQAYATGAVIGAAAAAGGLVGDNAGSVTQVYATGSVTGGAHYSGGLVGLGTVTYGYWDTLTSGQSTSASGTGQTTAQLQGALPSGFSSSVWGTGTGLYPYLTSLFPNGVQAVSGVAYKDAGVTPAASNASGAVTVNFDAGGSLLAQATTGNNGYYYVALPAGTVANGASFLVSTPMNSATGAVNAATVAASTYTSGTPAQTGVNLYGGFLAEPVSEITLSSAPSLSAFQQTANTLAGTDSAATSVIAALSNQGYLTTGASFTINQPYSGSGLLISTNSGDPLTVSSSITITSGGSLGLLSGGTLTIDAPVSAQGAVEVDLAYNSASSTNLSFGVTGTGFDGSLTYLGSGGGALTAAPSSGAGSLTINGGSYTLEYSLASLATDANANSSGSYALAENVLAPSTAYSGAVISSLSGTLEGLGHTITGLTITGTSNFAGLIGTSNGNVRDIGILGGAISGFNDVGGLVGYQDGGSITNAYATGAVSASSEVGGLVGLQLQYGAITNAYATGAVSGSSAIGGLVGFQYGTIENAYATGAVSGSVNVGGLVGFQGSGTITNAYATGAVSSSERVGGLVGFQGSGSTITNAYATGAVSGSAYVGGLVGIQDAGTIINAYWDVQTTGLTTNSGDGTGLTTAQLQSGGSGLVSTGSAFSGGTGGLYPYLTSFYPNGVQAISGIAYTNAGTTAAASNASGAVTVTVDANAARFGSATTGANGYYYVFGAAGSFASGSSVLAYTTANAATLTSATSASNQTGVNIYGNAVTVPTSATTLSAAPTLPQAQTLATAAAGSDSAAVAAISAATGLGLISSGASFTIDQPVTTASTLLVQTTATGAPITVAQPVTVTGSGSLGLLSAGGLSVDAEINVSGAGAVNLAAGYDTTTAPGHSLLELAFAQGSSLSFTGGAGAGASLTINGQPYTLLYDMTGVQGLNGSSGNFALADAIAGGGYTSAVVANFSGTFEGLGNTISNLTINDTSSNGLDGLFGILNTSGVVRDIGLVGGSVNGGGGNFFGALVAENNGLIAQSYATGTVSGSILVGGLVGANYVSGAAIVQSYATGQVSGVGGGNQQIGGLIGANLGLVAEAYATGAVSGSAGVGGLVGVNYAGGGTITRSYATGAVDGASFVGGLLGFNQGGVVSQSYWDTLTTGQSTNSGGTGLTTAQLQGTAALPGGGSLTDANHLGAAFAGGSGGLYPYLTNFYPKTPQAISGVAYADAGYTPAASFAGGSSAPQYVFVDIAGSQTPTTTGANGYYYVLQPAGALSPSGTATLAYTLQGDVAGPVAGATLIAATGTTQHLDIWANTLIAPTISTALSRAPTTASALLAENSGADQTLLASATGADTNAATGAAALSQVGYIPTTAAGFAIDQGINPDGLYVQTTQGPIAVTAAQTLGSTITLSLYSAGAVAFDASVTVQGPDDVNLGAATSTLNVFDLSFAQGASLSFTGVASPGGAPLGSLTINGQGYTLLNALANAGSTGPDAGTNDIAGIDNAGDGGHYALATNLSGANFSFGSSLAGAGANSFAGTFEGLGHTISSLTINDTNPSDMVGLFGTSTGSIRDIGLIGGSVTAAGNLSGLINGTVSIAVGALVGSQFGGAVVNAFASTSVTGLETENVGGLVGQQVSGLGLSGYLGYATSPSITNSYATGVASGAHGSFVGGLVGLLANFDGTASITNAYATGPVFADSSSDAGGLVGYGYSPVPGGTITNAYATGAVIGGSSQGGLLGFNSNAIITNAYWDTQTSGQMTSAGGTGLTTAQLQGATPISGSYFSTASNLGNGTTSAFAGGANGLYPYLTSFFPGGVQAVSGVAYKDAGATPAATGANGAVSVSAAVGGAAFGAAFTGVNGYYYIFGAAGSLPSGTGVATYTLANANTGAANAATYVVAAGAANTSGVNLDGGWLVQQGGAAYSSLSALNAAYASTVGALPPSTFSLANREIETTSANFSLDTTTTVSGTLALDSTGAVAQSHSGTSITAGSLLLEGSGGGFALATDSGNQFSTLAANTGIVSILDGAALTVGSVSDASGSTMSGVAASAAASVNMIDAGGSVTLAVGGTVQSGGAIVIAANGAFTNNAGANALTTGGGGSFQIYSQVGGDVTGALPGDSFGGLAATNYYNDAFSFATETFASAVPAGDHFVYGYQALLTPSLEGGAQKTYDGGTTAPTANFSLALTGLVNANGQSDSATASIGSAAYDDRNAGSGKTVTASDIVLASNPNNYLLSSTMASAAVGVITAEPITVTAAANSKTYDGTISAAATPTVTFGTIYSPDVGNFSETYASRNAGSGLTLTPTGSISDGNNGANYQVTFVGNTNGVITPEPITVTAAANSKTYDGTTSAASTPTVTFGTIYSPDAGTFSESYASRNAGTGLTLTPTGSISDGNNGANYQVTFVGSTNGVITPEPITVTAAANSKTYDGTTSAAATPTVTFGTIYSPDAGTFSESYASRNAGTGLTLTPTGSISDGNNGANYQVTYAPAATGAITPEPITVTAAANSKTYDGTTSAAATPTVTFGTIYSPDAGTFSESYASRNAGSGLTLTPTGTISDGNNGANYQVTYAPSTNGAITPEPITVTAAANSKTYDGTTSAAATPTVTFGTIYSPDAGTFSESYSSRNAGVGLTLTPTGSISDGNNGANYQVTFVGNTNGVITPEPITVTAAANSKTYDGTTSAAATPTVTFGTIYGPDAGTFSESYASRNAGTGLTLTPTGSISDGNNGANYQVTYAVSTNGVITPEPITVTAAANSKTYDGTTSAAATPTVTFGTIYSLDAGTFSETYASRNAGTGLTLTPTGTISDGNNGANYQVTYVASANGIIFAPGTPVVAPSPVTPAQDLASTTDRLLARVFGHPAGMTSFILLPIEGAGTTLGQIISGLGDPRFDKVVVCTGGMGSNLTCAVVVPGPQRTSGLESTPKP